MAPRNPATSVEQRIADLSALSRADLIEHWHHFCRTAPPKGIRRPLLVRAIAYQVQVKRWDGLPPRVARQLRKLAAGASVDAAVQHGKSGPGLKPGTRLFREWNGKTHVVEVVDKGFLWNGQRYRSLSATARAITNARWSGPRFFGLKGDAPT